MTLWLDQGMGGRRYLEDGDDAVPVSSDDDDNDYDNAKPLTGNKCSFPPRVEQTAALIG